jgi:hypothetical protein
MNRTTYRRARLVDDENADVLGMPLQLAILVLVAGLALAAIIAWFTILQTPVVATIEVQYDGAKVTQVPEGTVDLTISVWDDDENPLTGVVLSASGCGAQWSNGDDLITTDANNFQTTLTTNFPSSKCTVTITAEKSGLDGQKNFDLIVNGD